MRPAPPVGRTPPTQEESDSNPRAERNRPPKAAVFHNSAVQSKVCIPPVSPGNSTIPPRSLRPRKSHRSREENFGKNFGEVFSKIHPDPIYPFLNLDFSNQLSANHEPTTHSAVLACRAADSLRILFEFLKGSVEIRGHPKALTFLGAEPWLIQCTVGADYLKSAKARPEAAAGKKTSVKISVKTTPIATPIRFMQLVRQNPENSQSGLAKIHLLL
jgi:hypothetical protein